VGFSSSLVNIPFVWISSCIVWAEEHISLFPTAVLSFQYNWLTNQTQQHPFLTRFVQCLLDMRLYWHPVVAGLIISATFEFITGSFLEERKDVMEMELQTRRGDAGWPEYLRRMTSLVKPFSVFTFTSQEFGMKSSRNGYNWIARNR
jgi:hypothetical protein